MSEGIMGSSQRALKRWIDLLLSGLALAAMAVPFTVIAVAIALDTPGPVLFRQVRVGKDGRRFGIFKFRTMVKGAESMGTGIRANPGDFRITRVGRWLRLLSLDELPQILNVLRGEMSLVGPRPTVPFQVEAYTAYQRQRLRVKPGITGLAVIRGRNALTWDERIAYDIAYIEGWNLWLDLKILVGTPWVILVRRTGAYRSTALDDPPGDVPASHEIEKS